MEHRYIKAKTRGFKLQIGRFLFAKIKSTLFKFYKCTTKDCGSRCTMNIYTDTIRDNRQQFDNLAHFKSLIFNIYHNFLVIFAPFSISI